MGNGEELTRSLKLSGSSCSGTCACNGGIIGLSFSSLIDFSDCKDCCWEDGGGLMRLLVSGGRFSLVSESGGGTDE